MDKILISLFIVCLFNSGFSQSKFENNSIPYTRAEDRLVSFEKRKALQEISLFKNQEVRSVGPVIMSGRVVDLDVNPEDPTEFLVAYASGGLWKTTNNGISFFPVIDEAEVIIMGDIAVDWKRNIIYAGTGENNSSRSSYAGFGVYKSTDGGKSWTNIGLQETHRTGRIVIHPDNPDILWVGAQGHLYSPNPERGVYKTTDGGKTWKHTLFIDENTGIIDLEINKLNPQILYASTWHRERRGWNFVEKGKTSGIYKSTDGGENWFKLTTGNNGFPFGENIGRIGLSVYESNPEIIFAFLDNHNLREAEKQEKKEGLTKNEVSKMTKEDFLKIDDKDLDSFLEENDFPEKYNSKSVKELIRNEKYKPQDISNYLDNGNDALFNTEIKGGELYISLNGGESWERTHAEYLDNFVYTYGYFFGNVRVNPVDSSEIYLLGVPLLKSTNSGKSFFAVNDDNLHADHHALWINPKKTNHIISGNDGGINISYDGGNSWFKANTPPVGQCYSVNYDMSETYNVYAGFQDNGVWYGTSKYKQNLGWTSSGKYPYESLIGGDGMETAIDTRTNDIVYTGYQFGNYFRIEKSKKKYKKITPQRELGEPPYRFNWRSPIHISNHNKDIIYFCSQFVHRSLDKGENWEKISGDLTKGGIQGNVPFGTLTAVTESPVKFGLIYAGSDDGLVHISKNGGASWERITEGLPENFWISSIDASKFSEGRVYISLTGYRWDNFSTQIFCSEDYGKNWERIGKELPEEPVNVILEDSHNENVLYVGTDNSLYVSIDKGKTFNPLFKNLPPVPVYDLAIQPREKELLIGTHGRSVFIAKVANIQELTPEAISSGLKILDFKFPDYNKNWGMKTYAWEDPQTPSVEIPFYSSGSGTVKIEIKTEERTISEFDFEAVAGLNYFKYGLDTEEVNEKIKKADNGKYYILPGNYTVEISGFGVRDRFEVKMK